MNRCLLLEGRRAEDLRCGLPSEEINLTKDRRSMQPFPIFHHQPTAREQDRTGYNLLTGRYRDTRYADYALSNCSVYGYFEHKR